MEPTNRQYGRSFADVYDDWYGALDNPDEVIAMLQRLGSGSRVLELGVGTGRLALPLRDAGFAVVGLDSSHPMIVQMAKRTNRFGPDPVVADMVDLPFAAASFDVALIAYNTLFNLGSTDAQQRCLRQCSHVLANGGVLAIDTFVPAAAPPVLTRTISPARSTAADVVLIGTRQEGDSPVVDGVHLHFTAEGLTPRPWTVHTATPAEIDAMATEAGLALHQRCADWAGQPFGPEHNRHVSIYQKMPARTGR